MAQAAQGVEFNAELWRWAMNDVKSLNQTINSYLRAYIDAYETLLESFMNSYSEQPLRLLRAGTEEQMKYEVETIFARLQQNADEFGPIFENIRALVVGLRDQLQPTPGHDHTLHTARQLVPNLQTQIQLLETQNRWIRNLVLDREQYFGMVSIYRPSRRYQPEVRDWFPLLPNGETLLMDWYRYAHNRLLIQFETLLQITSNNMAKVTQQQEAMNYFISKYFARLHQRIPNLGVYYQILASIRLEITLQKDYVNILRVTFNSNGREKNWRQACVNIIGNTLPKIQDLYERQQQLICQLQVWGNQYRSFGNEEFNDIWQEFDAIFGEG